MRIAPQTFTSQIGTLKYILRWICGIVPQAYPAEFGEQQNNALGGVTSNEKDVLTRNAASALDVIWDAVAAVSANSPRDASEYGRLLLNVASQVAEASKEGGFLGIGGTRVNEEEQKAIDQIRKVVGIAA